MVISLNVPTVARQNAGRQAWAAFSTAVQPLPYTPDAVHPTTLERLCDGMPAGAFANAEIVSAVRNTPGYVRICLSERFFNAPLDQRILVLLHETTHIKLYQRRLAANYQVLTEVLRQRRAVAPAPGFEEERANLAAEILALAQEVGADKYILANYPAHRGSYKLMRRAYYEVPGENDIRGMRWPTLSCYRTFIYLVRAGLGLSVLDDGDDCAAIQQRYDELLALLRTESGNGFGCFDDERQLLLAIRVDTDDPDRCAFREVFDRISAVPNPAQDHA